MAISYNSCQLSMSRGLSKAYHNTCGNRKSDGRHHDQGLRGGKVCRFLDDVRSERIEKLSMRRGVVVYASHVSLLLCLSLCLLQGSDRLVSQWQFLRLYYFCNLSSVSIKLR